MKIGLALGSGAARGWTHIGIIDGLEALGIHIDVVAGCSIGAYVGAAYASNHLSALHDWAASLSEWQVLKLMGVGIRRGGIASGDKVFKKLQTHFCVPSFEDMHKPLAVVATDLYSGREVVFTAGEVDTPVRASCAIPALFSPVQYEGRWLVDGGVVNPVPVNLCRQLGADFVIAVNLNADFLPIRNSKQSLEHEKIQRKTDDFFSKGQNLLKQWLSSDNEQQADNQAPGILSVMTSSLEILQARVTRSRLSGDPPSILIEPHLTDIGMMDFHRAEELYQRGRDTVERLAAQIRYQLMLD